MFQKAQNSYSIQDNDIFTGKCSKNKCTIKKIKL